MEFEVIKVHEYYGNNHDSSREAKLYKDGTLEYLPEPEYEEEEDEEQCMS